MTFTVATIQRLLLVRFPVSNSKLRRRFFLQNNIPDKHTTYIFHQQVFCGHRELIDIVNVVAIYLLLNKCPTIPSPLPFSIQYLMRPNVGFISRYLTGVDGLTSCEIYNILFTIIFFLLNMHG